MFTSLCVVLQCSLFWSNLKTFFVRASDHVGITPFLYKSVKTSKKSAIFDNTLLDCHKASFENGSLFFKKSNPFKLQLKELISCDKPILNENIYPFPLKLFDWLQHWYFNYICVIFIIPCECISTIALEM